MPDPKTLWVAPKSSAPGVLPSAQIAGDSRLSVDVAGTVQEALTKLSQTGYDAVVCWAERQDELAGLIRIRKSQAELPILLMTEVSDPAFHDLSRQLGATRVLVPARGSRQTGELIREALLSGQLAGEVADRARQAREHARDIQDLTRENRKLVGSLTTQMRRGPRLSFIPLVVEGDPAIAFILVVALQKADVFAPTPILKDADEALTHLKKLASPENQGAMPLPSVLLLDADLPEGRSYEILAWVRKQRVFAQLPVILSSATSEPAKINQAYQLAANSFIMKPTEQDAMVKCLASLKLYWGGFNQGPASL